METQKYTLNVSLSIGSGDYETALIRMPIEWIPDLKKARSMYNTTLKKKKKLAEARAELERVQCQFDLIEK